MSAIAKDVSALSGSGGDLEQAVAALVRQQLAPQTVAIDREGIYPEAFMRGLGELGAYSQHLGSDVAGAGRDFTAALHAMEAVARECMSTGFCVWCQDALTWYIDNADQPGVRQALLPLAASGRLLGGTGLSNGMKHFAGIESLKIRLRRVDGGFIANGTLPWVSNLGPDHAFAAIFQREDGDGLVMAVTHCDQPGFSLRSCPPFTALEGSGTYACHFRDSFIPDERVISADFPAFIKRIRAGFVLLQMGMGLGLVRGCIDIMEQMAETHSHVNRFLDDQPAQLELALRDAQRAAYVLGEDVHDDSDALFADVLQLRLRGSELALRASQAAMLHAGARGYLAEAPAQRKLREAYFVAIVTPAMKHIRKELHRLGAA